MVDPFWNLVIDAHDQVAAHPETEIQVERGDRLALVRYIAATDCIAITLSLAKQTVTETEGEVNA